MNSLNRSFNIKSLCAYIRYYSYGRKTHYEVLKVPKNCTDKEIKDAFIRMSKEFHPDKNKDVKAQEHFVRIVEAYNVLSKPSSRQHYDSTSHIQYSGGTYVYKTHVPYNLRKNPAYNFYNEGPQNAQSASNAPYYGVKGINKLPNIAIIMACVGIAVIGVILQYVVIRKSYFVHRKQIDERSKRLSEELDKVRASTEGKTNEMQTQIILDRIVAAANPSVATASLGQALANDKK